MKFIDIFTIHVMFSRIVLCVLCFLTAHSLTVEGSSKTIQLHALDIILTKNSLDVTGPSKIYYIKTVQETNSTRNERVLQMSLLQHRLLPGDKLTFYDGNLTRILQEYTDLTHTPALSFYSTLPDAKVVFTANTSNVNSARSFSFLYRTVLRGEAKQCNRIFYGQRGVIDSSKHNLDSNESCRYTVYLRMGLHISLNFDNLTIPTGERLLVWKTTRLYLQPYGAPVKVFTHANNGRLLYIDPEEFAALVLEFNSTTQFKIRFQDYRNVFREVGESGEITMPIRPFPKYLNLEYWITVPKGYVKLTWHKLYLPKYDTIKVFRFSDRSGEPIRKIDNSTDLEIATIVSDSNRVVVKLITIHESSTANFRMAYSMLETAPKSCKTSIPNTNSSISYSKAYQGWKNTYTCEDGYSNNNFDEFTVLCQVNGVWLYTDGSECRKSPAPGSSKTEQLYAVDFVQILDSLNIIGHSRIYNIKAVSITNSTRNENVIQMSLLRHRLLRGDKLTFYDGNLTRILQEYTALTHTPALSFFSTLPDAKVVFTANASNVNSSRSFSFLYWTVPKGEAKECNRIFYGQRGVIDTSKHNLGSNESCNYTVYFKTRYISLIFDNLAIPTGERLLVWKTKKYYLQPYGAPVKVFTHANNGKLHYIEPERLAALVLEFNSTTQFKIRFQYNSKVFKEVGESGEITMPIRPFPKPLYLEYWITVPKGYVKLTWHELYLGKSDTFMVFRSGRQIRKLENSNDLETGTLVSDSNRLVVKLYIYDENSTSNFRMTYSMLETAPKSCKTSIPNSVNKIAYSRAYQGWENMYTCEDGYSNNNFDKFTVLCQVNGVWLYTDGSECRKSPAPDLVLILSLSLGIPFVILVALALGYVVSRYTTCLSDKWRVKLYGPGVVASSQHSTLE